MKHGCSFRFLSFATMMILFSLLNASCGPGGADVPVDAMDPGDRVSSPDAQTPGRARIALTAKTTLYENRSGVLEKKIELPVGATIEIPVPYQTQNLRYRKPDGTVDWTSTGFISPVVIVSSLEVNSFLEEEEWLHAAQGELYVFASVAGDLHGVDGNFEAIVGATPAEDFLKSFEANGKPKFNYTNAVKKRFGARLNKGVDPKKQTAAERAKWNRIYTELKRVANRAVPTPKAILMIDRAAAIEQSIAFEEKGVIPFNGAWTIAVLATAVRHGFPNVPCAEFMSEVVRQAYQRAGFAVTADFSLAKKNRLFWSDTAAVVNFSKALNTAGWVPWDTSVYRPVTGALMMHVSGLTPGHTYISAGHDGRLVMDNGSPEGRDLRKTTAKTINLMYRSGVFFLPPGINPPKW